MTTALILAAGVGQRMRNAGRPKQFLKIMNKPIIIYTLEKFEECEDVDNILVACHAGYVDELETLVRDNHINKVSKIFVGGSDRQESILRGMNEIQAQIENDEKEGNSHSEDSDIIVIHDGVRPLIEEPVICENILAARKYGCAITVHSTKESVVVTDSDEASIDDFAERAKTYILTSPQTFKYSLLKEALQAEGNQEYNDMPLLDAAMVYAKIKGKVHLVKEQGTNIKITTPEDYYYLRAILELEEQKGIFGL